MVFVASFPVLHILNILSWTLICRLFIIVERNEPDCKIVKEAFMSAITNVTIVKTFCLIDIIM